MKLYASIGLVVLVGAVGLGLRSEAFQSDKGAANVFENVENLTLNNPAPQEEPVFGALSGPDIPSPYLTVNGLATWYGSMAMRSATTTVCAIQSPNVTSTLSFASANWDVSSTTASGLVMAKSATAFVTTTLLNDRLDIAANAKALLLATSTIAIEGQRTFAPSQWLVIGMQGGVGSFSPTGMCKAEFKSVY